MIKTVSLEMAKKLKEAGFRQDTEKVYTHPWKPGVYSPNIYKWIILDNEAKHDRPFISAPTTDELLEELPSWILSEGVSVYLRIDAIAHEPTEFRVQYQRKFDEGKYTSSRIPVNSIFVENYQKPSLKCGSGLNQKNYWKGNEMKFKVYWIGKCDKCKYAKNFILNPLYWDCGKYRLPMYMVNNKCQDGIYYPRIEKGDKP